MKKIILSLVAIASAGSIAFAQNYDDIKNMLYLRQYKKAKESLDKSWSNAKFVSKPEAYIIKANVLAGLSADSGVATSDAIALRAQSREALNKYREMDPKMALVTEPGSIYTSAPITIYSGYFNEGINNYRQKNWPVAFENFKSAVEMSDLLREYKLVEMKLDTNGILLAGASAQSMKNDDEAEKYFVKLAEAKVGGEENEFLYQFLTSRALAKGDMVNFNKYLALGKELYPTSKYFQYDEIDYILAIENHDQRNKLIENKLAENPNDFKLQSAYGEILFDELNPKESDSAVLPSNYDELEGKMVTAFTKATEIKPESGLAMSNLANHFMNKSNRIAKRLDSVRTAIRQKNAANKPATTKPGTKAPPLKVDPADAALRDELSKIYDESSDKARMYYEKAVSIYSKLTAPSLIEKQQYRNGVGYLIDLAAEKKNKSKGNPAEYDKWEKEEKKWSDMYHKM
jgi:hypothetical protein